MGSHAGGFRLERFLTAVLALSAVAVAFSAVRASFGPRDTDGSRPPDFVTSWEEALPIGHPVGGDSLAPVTVLALVDLECPPCAGFHRTLSDVIGERPNGVRGVYLSHPLDYHRFALPAARAAECAAQVGAFERWTDAVYAKQDSLGLKSWGAYALEAGISDTAWIHACATNPGSVSRIEAARALGTKIRLEGTPTVLINGWRFHQTPTRAVLDSAIDAIIRKRDP